MATGRERVDAQYVPEISGQRGLFILQRNPGGIGNAVDCIEICNYPSGVDQPSHTNGCQDLRARRPQALCVITYNGFGKCDERGGKWHPTVLVSTTQHQAQINRLVIKLTARTEQLRMTGRSIQTLVKG